MNLHLISHPLCPYVQRAAIALAEKAVPFERTTIDLAKKPDWFLEISPLGKTPVLVVGDQPIFESAVILEYLEYTQNYPLHPVDALERARHRSWIEFASATLNSIAAFYNAKTDEAFAEKTRDLDRKFDRLENEIEGGPFFAGAHFSLVDAAFAPVFRYFDVLDDFGDFAKLSEKQKVSAGRAALFDRTSVRDAATPDYNERLLRFFEARNSVLSGVIARQRRSMASPKAAE